MHLTGRQLARLQTAIVAAFTRDELRQLLKVGLEISLEAITADKGLDAQVFDVLLWLERQDRLPEFAAAALIANPANRELAKACAAACTTAQKKAPKRAAPEDSHAPRRAPSPAAGIAAIVGIEWVAIPGGVQRIGSSAEHDAWAQPEEMPQHDVHVPGYWIARCPITNYQYQIFVLATEHPAPPHWPTGTYPDGKQDHPVVNISWLDALFFCRWANVQLPSEVQWERAARSAGGALWPWGDEPPTPLRCNFGLKVANTTPVALFPSGATAHGVLDMAGNVWEWTRSPWLPYPYDPTGGQENEAGAGLRVVRGGSYDSPAQRVRCACRCAINPAYGYDDVGMRVVLYNPAASISTRK
jgi:formylglycine-generating enzyme required for sulfatase activity